MSNAFSDTPNTRSLAASMLLCMTALAACQAPPPVVMSPAAQAPGPVSAMPPPQEPFDTTPITPVESAGAAAA